jgi:acetolactate synthase-1/2/3 large subunit
LPDDAVYFEDLTQVAYASRYMMPSYMPRTHISSGYQGTLGFGFASAMGAKVAFPNRPVMVANGDGGFMYTVQELATAVQHKINLVAVVFNDGAFGNVQRMQKKDYGGKVIGSDLQNPDFVALARAHGAASDRVHDPVALGNALREAFKRPLPTIIEVPVGEMSAPWKYIMMSRLRG